MGKEQENGTLFLDYTNLTLNDISARIHEIVSSDESILLKRGNINEWVTLQDKYLPNEAGQKQYIEIIKYIDELMINIFDKMKLINTIAWMLMNAHIPIENYDLNSLYLLIDYFKDVPAANYASEFKLVGNKEILLIIRYNTLDVKKRVSLLKSVIDKAKTKAINFEDNAKVNQYIEEAKTELKTKKADDILGTDGYI